MNSKQLITEICNFCESNFNEDNVIKYSRYFKGGFKGYGVPIEVFNEKVKEIKKRKDFNLNVLYSIAPELLSHGMYETTSIPIMLLKSFKKQFSKDVFNEIGKWFEFGIDNWAHADTLGMFIIPEFLLKDIINIDDLQPWINSPLKFKRRVAVVSMIKLLKVTNDFNPFFELITPLMRDPEREVHQGTGWFLREAWKIKPADAEEFLMKWKDQSPRLIFQYACEKMTQENKLRFKRGKQ